MKNWAKVIFILLGLLASAAEAVTVAVPTGDWLAPDGVTTITVEAWGGGGAGGGATGRPAKGGGGAGGQYAKKVVTVVPGGTYAVVVGAAGAAGTGNGGAGGDSTFDGTAVVAKGGAGGTGAANGIGGIGSTAGGVGDIVYSGGSGADSTVDTNCNAGGGGGGGAGSGGAGGNAVGNTGGAGTAVGGGTGGTATTGSGNGAAGAVAGGGGAGACAENNTDRSGGAGAAGQVLISYDSPAPVGVTYYHDTTNGVAIGFDGTTNVTSGTNQVIPPIITASLITANTCTGDARSQSHPAGLYTHSRWYLTSNYAVATNIAANPSGSARLRGALITDAVTVGLYDYDPVSGAKQLIGASAPFTLTFGGTTTNYDYTINSSDYVVPAGHRLMLQYDFDQRLSTDRARVVCSTATPSYITVTESAAKPVAEYRMDEASWNGTANEVADSSGNGLHGAAKLSATTATAKICYGANLAANYVDVADNALLDITRAATVTAWIKPARWGGAAGKDALMSILSKDTNYEAHITSTGNVNWWWAGGSITSAATVPIGAWTHVAMVYSDGSQTLYINGVASATGAVAGVLPVNASPFQIGNDQEFGGGTRRFDGMIDEVKIFNRALTPAQISAAYANENAGNNWDGTVRVCPTYAPHHLEIQHASGMGLTCAASTLTIKACADAACTSLYTSGVSGTLSATGAGMTVNWDGTTGGATGAGFVIPAGSGSVTKNVQVATAGTVAFGMSSATPAPTNGVTCNFGNNAPTSDNCVFTASTAGFIFSDTTTGSTYTIPAQVSGIATPQLYLRAVQASTTNPAVCTPAIVNSTTAVTMGYTCNDPATCQPGSLAAINATPIAPGGTSVNLAFDANGSAPITARYDDVGQITLDASATATPFAGGTAITLSGVSNAIVVAPHHFGFSGVAAAPIKAGNNFAATVTAYNGLATPTATANFGKETAAEGVTLSFSKCQPTGTSAVNGAFSGSAGSFAGGAASAADLNWSEVGNGDLAATLTSGSYLGSGLTASGNTGTGGTVCNGAGNVGPFIPDHFDTVVTGPMSCPAGLSCPLGGLVYSGQAFTANVYARNAAGATTQNYDGTANTSPNFAKAVTLTAWDAAGSTTTENPPAANPGSITGGTNAVASTAFNRGSTVSPGNPGAPVYTFGTSPTAPTDIYIRAKDTDNVTSLRVPANTSVEGGVKVVSGRIKLANAYGSELLALPVTTTAQYFNAAGGWVTSITDSVTQFNTRLSTAGGNVQATIVNGPLALSDISVVAAGTVTLANGVRIFRLAAPNVAGSADLEIITAPAYLLPGAVGRATFGVYKGPNEIIYMREAY